MRIALFETSSYGGGVAIAEDERILAERRLDPQRKHARDVAPAFDDLTRGLGLHPRSLDLVLVNIGPGSYTGLRVGLMSARTLAWATGAQLVGVDAMSALAASALRLAEAGSTGAIAAGSNAERPGFARPNRIRVIIDGQRGLVYAADLSPGDGRPDALASGGDPKGGACPWMSAIRDLDANSAVRILPATEWAAELVPGDLVTGPALDRYESLLSAEIPRTSASERQPDLPGLLSVGLARYRQGRRDDPMTLEPLYLRASSAELKWTARKAQSTG
jgi:tRNA threonylcarbamoyladenosine biosynthesis protein TsaB